MGEEASLIKYKGLSKKEKILLYFFLYSFLGWILETIYAIMVYGYFVKRGFLLGPICPIYGFGAILLIISLEKIKDNNWLKFFYSMVLFTIFEFIASWILEALFHQRWWDYSDFFLNIQGRVCFIFSLLWGIIGVVFSNVFHPYVNKKLDKILVKIPAKIQKIILIVFVIVFLADEVVSVLGHI